MAERGGLCTASILLIKPGITSDLLGLLILAAIYLFQKLQKDAA